MDKASELHSCKLRDLLSEISRRCVLWSPLAAFCLLLSIGFFAIGILLVLGVVSRTQIEGTTDTPAIYDREDSSKRYWTKTTVTPGGAKVIEVFYEEDVLWIGDDTIIVRVSPEAVR